MTSKPAVPHGRLPSGPFDGPPAKRTHALPLPFGAARLGESKGSGGADESHQDLWPGRGVLRERELGAEPEDGSRSGGDSQGPEVQPQGS